MSEISGELLEGLLSKDDFLSSNAMVNHAEALKRLAGDGELHQRAMERRRELLLRALKMGNMRAALILSEETEGEGGAKLLDLAVRRGYAPAAVRMEQLCTNSYEAYLKTQGHSMSVGPLTDMNGKPLRIKRRGLLDPVKAFLEYREGVNLLTLKVNVKFHMDVEDPEKWKRAVLAGFRRWEGDYVVFGGQPLRVKVEVSEDGHFWNSVLVCYADEDIRKVTGKMLKKMRGVDSSKKALFVGQRAFALMGVKKWDPGIPKMITLFPASVVTDKRIFDICGHEFGHILGIGDMYADESSGLPGTGYFEDIEPYRIWGSKYRMIMCDESSPVRNNDLEMVLLAFAERRQQNFQKKTENDKISAALGRGN